jgi:flagellar biogenesis protein FliO
MLLCVAIFAALYFPYSQQAKAENGNLIRPSGFSLATQDTNSTRGSNGEKLNATATADSAERSLDIRLKQSESGNNESATTNPFGSLTGSIGTTAAALVVTLGLFAALVLFVKRIQKHQQPRGLPREAFEVIGETEIGPKQRLLVVRCGLQALVIGVSPAGIQQVCQIDDPDEAGQFIAQCRGLGSVTTFNSTLRELEKEPASPGFIDTESRTKGKSRLFLRA